MINNDLEIFLILVQLLIVLIPLQQSTVANLLKGTSKGIHSLAEESLNITREMLREAQLAYPRSPVRDLCFSWSLTAVKP